MLLFRFRLKDLAFGNKAAAVANDPNSSFWVCGDNNCCYFYRKGVKTAYVVLASDNLRDPEKDLHNMLGVMQIKARVTSRKEFSITEYLEFTNQDTVSTDVDDVNFYKVCMLLTPFERGFFDDFLEEEMLEKIYTQKQAKQAADEMACTALSEELGRIYSEKAEKSFCGHPVHYIIQSDESYIGKKKLEVLLSSLHAQNRLLSSRFVTVNISKMKCPEDGVDIFYRTQQGSTVAVDLSDAFLERAVASDAVDNLQKILHVAQKHRRSVLTVFLVNSSGMSQLQKMVSDLNDMVFLPLNEDTFDKTHALVHLKNLAAKDEMQVADSALEEIISGQSRFTVGELESKYRAWYDMKLRTEVFPVYANVTDIKTLTWEKSRGTAWEELQGLIGLEEAKRVIGQAVDYGRAQKLFAERGIKTQRPNLHMVFTGNPGTAKTTVARLVAQIFKDNGLLSVGRLVEVGRGDLVGRYVGWTAQIVAQKFEEAKGSVLFIDEAYSLVDDKEGQFGDEAINAIVQHMENLRQDTVVIFAGYPKPMEQFLDRNEGLRSRIAFHVPFQDYSEDELTEIFLHLLKDTGRTINDADLMCVQKILRSAASTPSFGNGRFVRALLDRAIMEQASRLMFGNPEHLPTDDMRQLKAYDFKQQPKLREKHLPIGFSY